MEQKEKNSRVDDWEYRIPCKDESCIGTIGTDGRCRECGLPLGKQMGDQTNVRSASIEEEISTEDSMDEFDEDFVNDESTVLDDDDLSQGAWEERILCPDESCTGTIGDDGRCRVCGLAKDASQP